MIEREYLYFNVPLGDFEENQTYHMLTLIAKHFPKVSQKYLMEGIMEVLLLEALITLYYKQLQITFNQAEDLLENGAKREADVFMQKIQQKRKGKFSKKKKAQKRKMQAVEEAEDEVKFLNQARMDQTSIAKMQRHTFKLNQEDNSKKCNAYRPSNTNGPGTVSNDVEQLYSSATHWWYSLGLCQ